MQKHNCGGLKYLGLVAVLVAAFLGLPNRASAAFEIYAQQDGGAITLLDSDSDFGTAIFNGTFGDFRISVFAATSQNAAAGSDLFSSTVKVTNTDDATHTLTLYASQTNYTLPAGSPLIVRSQLGGSMSVGTTLNPTGIFEAFFDDDNALLGMDLADSNGLQNADFDEQSFDTGTASGLFDRDGSYSLTSVTNLTISGGGEVGFQNSITVSAVPEPGSLVLCGLGAGLVGFYGWRRRGLNPQPAIA